MLAGAWVWDRYALRLAATRLPQGYPLTDQAREKQSYVIPLIYEDLFILHLSNPRQSVSNGKRAFRP